MAPHSHLLFRRWSRSLTGAKTVQDSTGIVCFKVNAWPSAQWIRNTIVTQRSSLAIWPYGVLSQKLNMSLGAPHSSFLFWYYSICSPAVQKQNQAACMWQTSIHKHYFHIWNKVFLTVLSLKIWVFLISFWHNNQELTGHLCIANLTQKHRARWLNLNLRFKENMAIMYGLFT